jgi:hypothetical protein
MSTLLAACQTTPPTPTDIPGMELTVQSYIAATLTAAPTVTPLPTATFTPEPTLIPTPSRVQYGPSNYPENVNPLTGLVVSDPSILNRRPVMVKVANFPRQGRPHAGLSFADIVFDYYTGGGENRFLALFYGQDAAQAGPVRSGRYIDRWLVRMYQGILGMKSAYAPELDQILAQLGNRVIWSDHCPALCSTDGSFTETSFFVNTAELSSYYGSKTLTTNTRQTLNGMVFDSELPAGGADGHEVTMHFGKNNEAQWRYDAATGKYLSWIDQIDAGDKMTLIPLVDRLNGNQLAFSNVIILFAEIEALNLPKDSMHEIHIAGTKGRALIYRGGQVYDVIYKGITDTPISFVDKDGNPFPLQPGNTWIHFAGKTSQVTEDPTGVWRVVNYTP